MVERLEAGGVVYSRGDEKAFNLVDDFDSGVDGGEVCDWRA